MEGIQKLMWVGTVIHSISLKELEVLPNAILVIDNKGIIVELVEVTEEQNQVTTLQEKYKISEEQIVRLEKDQVIIPGLIDCHTHAPQYPNIGVGLDKPLLEWLDTYTFPTESAMSDVQLAKDVYSKFVDKLIRNGTTTVCYFATLHLEATKALADIVHERGQRAWVGKVNMDWYVPEYLSETTEESLRDTEKFIQYLKQDHFLERGLVEPCVTPRFAPTCSPQLLKGLGELVAKYQVPVQSHLCESHPEIDLVRERHPDYANYAEVYNQNGLMTNRTVMAHCIHLQPEEQQLFSKMGSGVAHCASSNFNLSSGVLDIRPLLQQDIKVGLGTDVSGGSSPSMLHALQSAFIAAKLTQVTRSLSDCPLNLDQTFYLATLGGARVMGLDHLIGNFQTGKQFDALVINLTTLPRFPVPLPSSILTILPPHHTLKTAFAQFLQTGDESHISQVYVQGRPIHSNPPL